MKRREFKAPRQLHAGQPATAAAAAATPPSVAVFDCLFTAQHKKKAGAADGTLVVHGSRAQLLDLQLQERAAGSLPAGMAPLLHAAYAAAVAAAAAGALQGPLWQQGQEEEPNLVVGQFAVTVEDDRSAAVAHEEFILRQQVGAEARGGKPKDASGAPIPPDNLGARMLASMGWQPGMGVGRTPGAVEPVLPQLKWDKAGLGSSANVKRVGPQRTTFRRATAKAGAGGGAGASLAVPASSSVLAATSSEA